MSRTRLAVVVGVALAVALLWWVLVWQGRAGQVLDAEEAAGGAQAQEAQLRVRVASAQRFTGDGAAASRQQLEVLRAEVPEDGELGRLVVLLDEAADATAVSLSSVTPAEPEVAEDAEAPDGLDAVPVVLTLDGEEARVLAFLDRLGDLERAVVVDDVELVREGDGAVTANVALRAFSATDPDDEDDEG